MLLFICTGRNQPTISTVAGNDMGIAKGSQTASLDSGGRIQAQTNQQRRQQVQRQRQNINRRVQSQTNRKQGTSYNFFQIVVGSLIGKFR